MNPFQIGNGPPVPGSPITRTMPAVSRVLVPGVLPFGFDLSPAALPNAQFVHANLAAVNQNNTATVGLWTPAEVAVLLELVEIYMRLVRRHLGTNDFQCITEALHRLLPGTINRGWNPTHSKIMRTASPQRRLYDELYARLEIGGY